MNTAKRDKIILAVLIVIVIAAIMFYIAIKPCADEVKDLNAKIDKVSSEIDGHKSKSNYIKTLSDKRDELKNEVEILEKDMSSFEDYAMYLSDFQKITDGRATKTDIAFVDETVSSSGYYTIVRASIKFNCNYEDLKYIMDELFARNVHCYDIDITSEAPDVAGETSNLIVSFTADYISSNDGYVVIDYEFLSNNYGLSDLFDGVVVGAEIGA